MMKNKTAADGAYVFLIAALTAAANCFWLMKCAGRPVLSGLAAILTLLALGLAVRRSLPGARLRLCALAVTVLRACRWSALLSLIYHAAAAPVLLPGRWPVLAWSAVVCLCVHTAALGLALLCLICASKQLTAGDRVLGALLGLIPLINLPVLARFIRVVTGEVASEAERIRRDEARAAQRVCKTIYPILLVHGVFFRDFKYFDYWGRIPAALKRNGATVFYGGHQSAASVESSAAELAERIRAIAGRWGKVNIIAHSKGGLDCRWALAHCGVAQYVASLTTVNTPHRGCRFADYLLDNVPESTQKSIAAAYEAALRKLGDSSPDFMAAVRDLTAAACIDRDEELGECPGVFCQSVGSRLERASGGKFPLNFTYALAKHFDGPNDGLVSAASFHWGEKYTFITGDGKHGVSHGDVIDLTRRDVPGFDVREFYVGLVSELKNRGL